MEPDAELLQRFADKHDQGAFTALVRRHVDLVFAAALRRTGGRHHLAEDIAQRVFCALAQKASTLRHHPVLTGWLYQTTRYTAIDVLRSEFRHDSGRLPWEESMNHTPEPTPEVMWESVRPELDAAMDALKERDRQLILLRYFEGRSYRDVGECLQLSENTARMRAGRALEKLRLQLDRRGAVSSAALLAGVLTSQAVAATPASTVASITSAALAINPAPTGLAYLLLMSKLTAPLVSAVVAAGLTTFLWTTAVANPTEEIASLRRENAHLVAATAPTASADAVAGVTAEFAARALSIATAVEKSRHQARGSTSARQSTRSAQSNDNNKHADHGQATPHDAMLSFTWASDAADIEALAKLIYFDGNGRDKAAAVLANLPAALREQYKTPEELYAFLVAADALLVPPPDSALLEKLIPVETGPGRIKMCSPITKRGRIQLQETTEGWKWVLPERSIEDFANQVLSSEMLLNLQSK